MEAARLDARSDLLLFGVMQAATAGADLSPDRSINAQRAPLGTADHAFFSTMRPSTNRQTRGSSPNSSDSLSGASERSDNQELRQRLLAAEASVAREKAKGDQWLRMIGSLREELAQAHRCIDALAGDGDSTTL